MSKIIENQIYPYERALYAAQDTELVYCIFDGEEDGESALKEAKNIKLTFCRINLRYPLWHDEGVKLFGVEMTEKCRAALWYTKNATITESKLHGIKAVRECLGVKIENSSIISPEFGWKCRGVEILGGSAESEYFLFLSKDIIVKDLDFKGKYSFQYAENARVENSYLDTKDAFWHTKNVTVKNCVIKGEYLAWYAEGLTLINCKIIGTQPLCYCKNLTLINCETENADLAFEYSEVNADIKGDILSVKNPLNGKIIADGIGKIILTDDSVYPSNCEIKTRK